MDVNIHKKRHTVPKNRQKSTCEAPVMNFFENISEKICAIQKYAITLHSQKRNNAEQT